MPEPFLPPCTIDDVPESVRGLCLKARDKLGFVPNVFLSYARRPELFSAWFTHFSLLQRPTENLGTAERELIAVVVSSINRCTYCLGSHGQELRHARGEVANTDRIMISWRQADLTEREQTICAYVEKLTVRPDTVDAGDLQTLRDVGLTDDEIWDVVELTSMYAFTNRLSLGLGIVANDEYYHLDRGEPQDAAPAS